MTDVAPFRERPKFLLCPRCGELLEHAFDSVLTCLRCEGLWIAPVTLERVFGDPRWPRGSTMWWRNVLECPECATEGQAEPMTAVQAGDVVVDRCPSHGVWVDRTELCRLMGSGAADAGSVSPDLAALRAQLDASDADLEQLARRREAWRSDLGARRKAAQEYRTWLEAEHRRRQEAAAALERAERERARAREQEAAGVRAREAATEAEQAKAQAEAKRARSEAEQAKERAERARAEAERARRQELEQREQQRTIQRLGDARQTASADVERLESRIIMLREQLRAAEAELAGARGRLWALDRQLDDVQTPPG